MVEREQRTEGDGEQVSRRARGGRVLGPAEALTDVDPIAEAARQLGTDIETYRLINAKWALQERRG